MSKRDDLRELVQLVGEGHARLVDAGRGWPGRIEVKTGKGWVPVAAHVGRLGESGRDRDDRERRFQNPMAAGDPMPVTQVPGHLTMLLGLWSQDRLVPVKRPVVVAMEITAHRLEVTTRQSLFSPLWLLQQVSERGWGEHQSSSGERLVAFWPELLPTFVELDLAGAEVSASEMAGIVGAAGVDAEDEEPIERARKQATILARSRIFAADVVNAYGGECAMCGLDAGLVEGAHIYPASAPRSSDKVWNGVCLCPTHHKAFDRHLIWIEPATRRRVAVHPSLHQQAQDGNKACESLISVTQAFLRKPLHEDATPREAMFVNRYQFYPGLYDWVAA